MRLPDICSESSEKRQRRKPKTPVLLMSSSRNGTGIRMNFAVLYVRVSTDEQASQVHNLPTQQRKCTDRCTRDSLTVEKTFIDADSARTADRPQFQAMLDYCRKHKGKITHVVFADLSRLARNVGDQSVTLATLRQLGITPVSCDDFDTLIWPLSIL